jgi:RIO-like serine/threonine protein kinase
MDRELAKALRATDPDYQHLLTPSAQQLFRGYHPDNELPPTSLIQEDVMILQALAQMPHRVMAQEEIASASHVSRKTLGRRLRQLRLWGFVRRPQGPRGGEQITENGIAILRADEQSTH